MKKKLLYNAKLSNSFRKPGELLLKTTLKDYKKVWLTTALCVRDSFLKATDYYQFVNYVTNIFIWVKLPNITSSWFQNVGTLLKIRLLTQLLETGFSNILWTKQSLHPICRQSRGCVSEPQSNILELQPFSWRLRAELEEIPLSACMPLPGAVCPQGWDGSGFQTGCRGG